MSSDDINLVNLKEYIAAAPTPKKAFTLIELLVVISIIALLLSILAPSLAKVRKQTATVICTTRFKDIGNALGMYNIDYDGKMPAAYITSTTEAEQYAKAISDPDYHYDPIWMSRISNYYDKQSGGDLNKTVYDMEAFRCPTQDYYLKLMREYGVHGTSLLVTSPKTGRQIGLWAGGGTFGYNVFFSGLWAYAGQWNPGAGGAGKPTGTNTFNFRRAEAIKNSSNLPMVADLAAEPFYGYKGAPYPPESQANNIGGWLLWPQWPHPMMQNYGWKGGWWSYGPAPVHEGKINYLFADGHAEVRKMWPWDDVDYIVGDGHWDRIQYFHPEGKNRQEIGL